jgi:hypothetical protein
MSVVRINTVDLEYNKGRKTLVGCADRLGIGFPSIVEVKSHITNRVVTFIRDEQKMIDNEGFDGEESHYLATEYNVSAQHLVLLAQ